ncbi:MAG: signal peptidase I [Candidatus Dormibacteraceae bacterium]
MNTRINPRGVFWEIFTLIGFGCVLFLIIQLAIQAVKVDGCSMYPTLHNKDYLIELKLPYYFSSPQRGDIVILKYPENQSENLIKRVIGLPGDRILIQGGKISINGHILDERYLQGYPTWTWFNSWPPSNQSFQLAKDELFVMGDNRNDSKDSRIFGPVKRNSIEGKAWVRILPLDRFGWIHGAAPYSTNQCPPPQGDSSIPSTVGAG